MLASVVTRIEEEEKLRLVEIAKKEDLSVSQLVRRAIREYLDKYKNS